ncbi:integrase [Oceanidesulfovibrio indonesiensis]|uniref:Integrase n=1 Tax=Oceanidesulfovibrio indonesiensis TaxID=54767 RepID=A0A7M3MGS7_9BACT|nr:site-specific integrase [Oceanidesulfovibrio indonesiensis]TVM18685.1 integrase [Oceanidesulfovibrio indonesiensis]
MEKMPGHPRLFRRGAVYYHRAAIPVDIKDTYPKTEETFSLKTKDYREALRKVRVAAVKVDQRFEEHRRRLAQQAKPPVKELSGAEIKRIGEIYYAYRLEEDDEARLQGFSPAVRQTKEFGDDPAQIKDALSEQGFTPPSFDEYVEDHKEINEITRHDFARGQIDPFFVSEAMEVLTWDGIDIRLDKASPSWRKLVRELQAASIKAAKVIQQRNEGGVIETPSIPGVEPGSVAPLLSVAVEDWIDEKTRTSWVPKTAHEHRTWMSHFIAVIGDKPIDTYTKADARAFKAMLLKLPANWVKYKELNGLPLDKAAEKSHRLGLPPMSDKNVNKLLGYVGSFWNWAADNYDDVPTTPFKGLKIKLRKKAREERDPFTLDELHAIFNAPIYTGCKSRRFWSEPGSEILRDSGYYWVPLISLYTGARMGEIIQLYTEDIREEDGILFFDINSSGEDKRLKTTYSIRSIPIHQSLLDMGFMELVEKHRKRGDKRLFPDLPMGKDGYYSSPFSKWFSRFLREAGVKSKTNAFHSFRHCFEDACRDSDISKEIMDALQGHGEEGMSDRYGRGYMLQKLNEAMQRLQYRGLDLDHLKINK